jgi:hypothetical protein
MALFTDGIISGLEDLAAQDSSILDIANSEGIDLTRKLELAQGEVGIDLTAAVSRIGSGQGLESVVVTPPLKLWHTFRALELAYRDAYHNQLNDRYKGRRDEYRELARWAAEKLFQTGIGFAVEPLSRAEVPVLRVIEGSLPAGMYFVTMCWVGSTGQESASAPVQSIELTIAGGVEVRPAAAPRLAAGWNAYIGESEDNTRKQNTAMLGLNEQWSQAAALSTDGKRPSNGPEASSFRQSPRVLLRG